MGFVPQTRRSFLCGAAYAAGAGAAGLTGFAGLVEPFELSVETVDVHLRRLPAAFDGLRIVLLSDFHYGPFTGEPEIAAAVAKANLLQPDLVALTGDFVSAPQLGGRKTALEDIPRCARLLGGLRAPLGVFACLGNHDVAVSIPRFVSEMQRSDIRLLLNSRRFVERGGARLWLAGIDDALNGGPNIVQTLRAVPREELVILLAHEPDFADTAVRHGVDLQLSGHSHGGQIRLPLWNAPWLPPMARKYPFGHYRIGDLQLYTNRGIGTIGVPFRFGAVPEVTLLTLRSQPGAQHLR